MTKTRKLEWAYALFGTCIAIILILAVIIGFIYLSITDFRIIAIIWGAGTMFGLAFFITFLIHSMMKLTVLIEEKSRQTEL